MPRLAEIQRYFVGVWRMMMGRPDGIKLLDISADGFWNSFFAIAVALPALIVGWVSIANSVAPGQAAFGARLSVLLKLATVDIGAWVLPLVAFAAAARPAGLADRLAHYVISSNWGSALIVWMMLPPTLLRLFYPAADDIATAISIGLFGISLVLSWRLTNSALSKGAGVATAVFGAMFLASLAVLFLLQSALGLDSIEPPTE
jgi:hypothetical protein